MATTDTTVTVCCCQSTQLVAMAATVLAAEERHSHIDRGSALAHSTATRRCPCHCRCPVLELWHSLTALHTASAPLPLVSSAALFASHCPPRSSDCPSPTGLRPLAMQSSVLPSVSRAVLLALLVCLLSLSSLAHADQSLCDKYSMALFNSTDGKTETKLIAAVVTRAVLGDSTVDPPVDGLVGPNSPILQVSPPHPAPLTARSSAAKPVSHSPRSFQLGLAEVWQPQPID